MSDKIPTLKITINLDQKCKKCGNKGAMPSGICLDCDTKKLIVGRKK